MLSEKEAQYTKRKKLRNMGTQYLIGSEIGIAPLYLEEDSDTIFICEVLNIYR